MYIHISIYSYIHTYTYMYIYIHNRVKRVFKDDITLTLQ